MAATFRRGMRVLTRKFGVGTIKTLDQVAAQVSLQDFGGLCVRLPVDELEPADPPPAVPDPVPIRPVADPTRAALLRSAEALRFGIVPAEAISRVTVGFQEIESWVTGRLPSNGRPTVSEISGSFGTGKSHIMAAIRHIAASAGYVTASVEVDGSGVTLSDPGMLLFHLLGTIDSEKGLTATPMIELNQRACERGYQGTREALAGFARILANYDTVACLKQAGDLDAFETTLDLLMAGSNDRPATDIRREILLEASPGVNRFRIDPKRLVGVPVDERPIDFADCLLGYARLATRAGFKGLVVTLDEFEVEYRAFGFKYVPPRVLTLVDVLSRRLASLEATGPLALFIAAVGQGGEEGDAVVQQLLDAANGDRRRLRKWTSTSLRQLAKRVHKLYAEAYGLADAYDEKLTEQVERTIQDADVDDVGHVRAFVKSYVAELDRRFGPPAV
jgi:hypothetical protein